MEYEGVNMTGYEKSELLRVDRAWTWIVTAVSMFGAASIHDGGYILFAVTVTAWAAHFGLKRKIRALMG